MRELDFSVMPHAFATQNRLGCLCDESVYQAKLSRSLIEAGFQVIREVPITLSFREFVKPLFMDAAVNQSAIYELKTVSHLTTTHEAQLLNYLFLTNAARGKLINFRSSSIESWFVNSTMDDFERRRFRVESQGYQGTAAFQQLLVDLVTDWGTGLDQSLYTQAVVHCLGGEELVTRQVPVEDGGVPIGNQRFLFADDQTAFRITTFQEELCGRHQVQLHKLLSLSVLQSLNWVNIARHQVTFITVRR